MGSLFAFDFDQTIIDLNAEPVLLEAYLTKAERKELKGAKRDWQLYMNSAYQVLHKRGFGKQQYEETLNSLLLTDAFGELLRALHQEQQPCIIISDCNTFCIETILRKHGLEDVFSKVITNKAHFEADGLLVARPCMEEHSCSTCPPNLCKGEQMRQICAEGNYERIVFVGDGENDLCACRQLRPADWACSRRHYSLDSLLHPPRSPPPTPPVACNTLTWTTGLDLLTMLRKNGFLRYLPK